MVEIVGIKMAKRKVPTGVKMPVHKLLQQKPMPSLVKVQHVVNHSPNSIYQTDAYGRSPLFLAVYLNLPSTLIRFILILHPEAASIPNHMGEVPLHVARTIPIAKLLISMFPGAIHMSTKSKWLPIHTARSSELTHLFLQEGIKNSISARSNNYKNQTTFFARIETKWDLLLWRLWLPRWIFVCQYLLKII
jgi:hypothetical protein